MVIDNEKERKSNKDRIYSIIELKKILKKILQKLNPSEKKAFTKNQMKKIINSTIGSLNIFHLPIITKYMDKYCEKCGNCCRNVKLINLTLEDLYRLKPIVKNIEELVYKKGGKYFFLKEPNQPCRFLENNLCIIYEHRPDVCRFFPFTSDPFKCQDQIPKIVNYSNCNFFDNLIVTIVIVKIKSILLEKTNPELLAKIEEYKKIIYPEAYEKRSKLNNQEIQQLIKNQSLLLDVLDDNFE
ncbi:MAG: YkgJ family cysteine cluster protein [Candidatus Lokiarchaeota archaeon]|nr:YkgJ family cysteine cluster protein [Candidatus Lokiarchaeota archaeon]